MYEEQRLMAKGVPFSEVQGICQSLHRGIAMGRFDPAEHPANCKCGGLSNCPDCPHRNK